MSDVCAICLSDLGDDPSLLQTWTGCNQHTFHKACLCGWLMQGKQTCPSCRSNLMVNKDSDVESVISADSDSSSDSDESSASDESSVSSVASSSSSSSSSSSFSAFHSIAGTSPSTSSDEEDDDDEDFLSEYRVRITIPEGLIDAENKHTKKFHDSYDGIMETGVTYYDAVADNLKEALTEQAMKYKEQVKERYVLYAKLNKYIRMNCPVFVPRSTSSAIRKNVDKNKKIMDRFHHVYRRQLNEFTKVDKKWLNVSKVFSDIIADTQIQLRNTQVSTLSITRQLPTMDA